VPEIVSKSLELAVSPIVEYSTLTWFVVGKSRRTVNVMVSVPVSPSRILTSSTTSSGAVTVVTATAWLLVGFGSVSKRPACTWLTS